MDDLFDDDNMEDEIRMQERRKYLFNDQEDEEIDDRLFLDSEEVKGKLSEWIKQNETVKYIKIKFRGFLLRYKGDKAIPIYATKLREMCTSNRQSI